MEERNYTYINLTRELIRPTIDKFVQKSGLSLRNVGDRPGGAGLRVQIGNPGIEDCTLDIFFNKCGTCSLQYKLGKNQPLGKAAADALYETIHPDEFTSVNLVLKGIHEDDIEPVLIELAQYAEHVEQTITEDNPTRKVIKLQSRTFQDSLTVTHHKTTHKLQVQGKPLSCYRELIYLLTELLELNCLDRVLIRKDEGSAEIVRTEMALAFLQEKLGDAEKNIPETVKKLLLSSMCVKLATPNLPDYSMLIYPELRSLEGALKDCLGNNSIDIDGQLVGDFFTYLSPGNYALDSDLHDQITDAGVRSMLGEAYSWYNKHRHGLFHMEDITEGSRLIGNFDQLISLSDRTYQFIKELYA